MTMRIRYEKSGRDHILQSTKIFTAVKDGNRSDFRVFLDVDKIKFFIRNEVTRDFVAEGEVKLKSSKNSSLTKLKRLAKEAAISLGLCFDEEGRVRSKGGNDAVSTKEQD